MDLSTGGFLRMKASIASSSITTLKELHGRNMVVFCLRLNECPYCKVGNNQLCELRFKLKSLCCRKGQLFFSHPIWFICVEV